MLPDQAARWVTDVAGPGSQIVTARRLRLGGWHVNHAVDVADGRGRIHRLVLRRWARPGWETDDPDYTVGREARVLGLLAPTPVPAPGVVAADPEGTHCDVPAILLTRLPGHPLRPADPAPSGFCAQLAESLAEIHDVGGAAQAQLGPYRLYYDRARAVPVRWMTGTPVWAQAIAVARDAPPPTAMTLIHRDYHPENTLWSRSRLTGVVDWTQASWGPPELDVAHMRWNLVADQGQQAADQFLACYRATTGRILHDQPYWDSSASSTSCSGETTPATSVTSDPMICEASRTTPRQCCQREPGVPLAHCARDRRAVTRPLVSYGRRREDLG